MVIRRSHFQECGQAVCDYTTEENVSLDFCGGTGFHKPLPRSLGSCSVPCHPLSLCALGCASLVTLDLLSVYQNAGKQLLSWLVSEAPSVLSLDADSTQDAPFP